MSLKLLPVISLDEWQLYLKGSLATVLKAVRKDFVRMSSSLTVAKIIEVIYTVSRHIENHLSFTSPQEHRFAPKFPRYLFFDVDANGSLQVILTEICRFCEVLNDFSFVTVSTMSYEMFQDLYNKIYEKLLGRKFVETPRICIATTVSNETKANLQSIVQHLRGVVTTSVDESTIMIRHSLKNVFIPSIPQEFVQASQTGATNTVVDLTKPANANKYFLRLLDLPEGSKKQGSTLVHIRCLPHVYDLTMNSKVLSSIRIKQTGCTLRSSLMLDDFPDSIYAKKTTYADRTDIVSDYLGFMYGDGTQDDPGDADPEEEQKCIILPPQYLTDSMFFNEWLDTYDYVTSLQENKLASIQLNGVPGVAVPESGPAPHAAKTERPTRKGGPGKGDVPIGEVSSSSQWQRDSQMQSASSLVPTPGSGTLLCNAGLSNGQQFLPGQIQQAYPYGSSAMLAQQYSGQQGCQPPRLVTMSMERQPRDSLRTSPFVLRGYEQYITHPTLRASTLIIAHREPRCAEHAGTGKASHGARRGGADVASTNWLALQVAGVTLAGIQLVPPQHANALFVETLKSKMVGRPRREDFNPSTLTLTSKMRRFIEGDDGSNCPSSMLNLYIKYAGVRKNTIVLNIFELCSAMRKQQLPMIQLYRTNPEFYLRKAYGDAAFVLPCTRQRFSGLVRVCNPHSILGHSSLSPIYEPEIKCDNASSMRLSGAGDGVIKQYLLTHKIVTRLHAFKDKLSPFCDASKGYAADEATAEALESQAALEPVIKTEGSKESAQHAPADTPTSLKDALAAVPHAMRELILAPQNIPLVHHARLSAAHLSRIPDWFSCFNVSQNERLFLLREYYRVDAESLAFPGADDRFRTFDWSHYLTARNTIITAWRCMPHMYLSALACKDFIKMETTLLFLIHRFLDESGIINNRFLVLLSTVPVDLVQDPLKELIYARALAATTRSAVSGPWKCDVCHWLHSSINFCVNFYSSNRQNPPVFICPDCSRSIHSEHGLRYIKITPESSRMVSFVGGGRDAPVEDVWTDIDILYFVNMLRKLIKTGASFYTIWDSLSEALDRAPESCMMRYMTLLYGLGRYREDASHAGVYRVLDDLCHVAFRRFEATGLPPALLQKAQEKFGCDKYTTVYSAYLARAFLLSRREESRACMELNRSVLSAQGVPSALAH